MALTNGKRVNAEIDGIPCSIIEDKVNSSRLSFLKELLIFNKLDVKYSENINAEDQSTKTYIVGVTDVTFNIIIAIYEKRLYNRNGKIVTPSFWNQDSFESNIPYWTKGRQIAGIYKEDSNQ